MLKSSRLYDAAAPIGVCDVINAYNTMGKPTFSWRYYLCLDFARQKKAVNFVTSLWEIEEISNHDDEADIRLSERCFHQMLLGRNSPFACTNFIQGNALSVFFLLSFFFRKKNAFLLILLFFKKNFNILFCHLFIFYLKYVKK